MKKFVSMILVVMMLIGIGITANAVYEVEEAPAELIIELVDAGFKPSEDDEDIWVFDGYCAEDAMMYFAYFNVVENYGAIYGEDPNSDARCIIAIRWNNIDEEFEQLGEGFTKE